MFRSLTLIPSNILLLTIPKESAQAYYELEELCYLRVAASDYVRLDLPQCHRCQKIGHSSQLCNRAFKCVRCGGGHAGEPCTAPSCKCANCGADHPASYRGCPVYAAAKARQSQFPPPARTTPSSAPPTNRQTTSAAAPGATATTTPTPTPRATTRPPPPAGQSAQPAEVADTLQANARAWQGFRQRRQTQQNPTDTPITTNEDNPIKEIIDLIKSFNIKNFIKTLKDFMTRLKTMTDPTDKLLLIIETISNLF